MKTIGFRPVENAQDIIDEIHGVLGPVLVPAYLDNLYPFRWQPAATTGGKRVGSLTATTSIPTDSAENNNYHDIILMAAFYHNGTPAELEAAERAINGLEAAVWNALIPHRAAHWNRIEPPRPSIKPGAPEGAANWRAVYIYIRAGRT